MTDDERNQCEECRKATMKTLADAKAGMARLAESIDLQEKEMRFLAWQAETFKAQIAALKAEKGIPE